MVTGWGPVLQCGLLTVRGSRDSSPGSTPILGLDSTPIQYLQTAPVRCLRGRSHITSAAGGGRGGKPKADNC